MTNESDDYSMIVSTSIQQIDFENDPIDCLVIGVTIDDPSLLSLAAKQVADHYKIQRMMSKSLQGLFISLMGACTADQLASAILELVPTDPILKLFVAELKVADIVHGTEQGEVLDGVSLLATED